jgi:hypothetical protein
MESIGTDKYTSYQEAGYTGEVNLAEDINYGKRDDQD